MARAAAAQPVGGPLDQLPRPDARVAEQPMHELAVAQQSVGRLAALEGHAHAEPLGELLRQSPHAQQFRPGDVDHPPRAGDVGEGAQGRALEVVTTHLLPGYIRKNGFPVSGNATVKEDFDLFTERNGQPWFVVTTIVEDPLYLQEPFVTSS